MGEGRKLRETARLTFAACAIQTCLTRNNYSEAKCEKALKELYQCCSDMYKRLESEGKPIESKSPSCPLPNVVARKMKQLGMS